MYCVSDHLSDRHPYRDPSFSEKHHAIELKMTLGYGNEGWERMLSLLWRVDVEPEEKKNGLRAVSTLLRDPERKEMGYIAVLRHLIVSCRFDEEMRMLCFRVLAELVYLRIGVEYTERHDLISVLLDCTCESNDQSYQEELAKTFHFMSTADGGAQLLSSFLRSHGEPSFVNIITQALNPDRFISSKTTRGYLSALRSTASCEGILDDVLSFDTIPVLFSLLDFSKNLDDTNLVLNILETLSSFALTDKGKEACATRNSLLTLTNTLMQAADKNDIPHVEVQRIALSLFSILLININIKRIVSSDDGFCTSQLAHYLRIRLNNPEEESNNAESFIRFRSDCLSNILQILRLVAELPRGKEQICKEFAVSEPRVLTKIFEKTTLLYSYSSSEPDLIPAIASDIICGTSSESENQAT